MDQQTIIDMKNQAKLWDRIDSKMEDRIKSLKATGRWIYARVIKHFFSMFLNHTQIMCSGGNGVGVGAVRCDCEG